MNTIHAHGKLLISAEYMVMHGSQALALPLIQGQSLQLIKSELSGEFSWKAVYQDHTWFKAKFDPTAD